MLLGVFVIAALAAGICVSTSNVAKSSNQIWSKIDCKKNYTKYKAGVVTNGIECAKIGR